MFARGIYLIMHVVIYIDTVPQVKYLETSLFYTPIQTNEDLVLNFNKFPYALYIYIVLFTTSIQVFCALLIDKLKIIFTLHH